MGVGVGGGRPNLSFFHGRKMGDERHTRGRLSAGSPVQGSVPSGTPLCCLCASGDGDTSPAWRAEVGSDVDSGDNYSKTSLLPAGEEGSHRRREAPSPGLELSGLGFHYPGFIMSI